MRRPPTLRTVRRAFACQSEAVEPIVIIHARTPQVSHRGARQPRAASNVFWAPTGEEPNAAELLLYALLVVRAYPRKADREEWLSYLLAEAKRALEARGGWEEPQTARWGRHNKVSAMPMATLLWCVQWPAHGTHWGLGGASLALTRAPPGASLNLGHAPGGASRPRWGIGEVGHLTEPI